MNLGETTFLQYPGTTAEEVASVIVSVEPNQIAVQDSIENLIADWQDTVDFTGWERSVQEEAELDVTLRVTNLLTKHSRQEH